VAVAVAVAVDDAVGGDVRAGEAGVLGGGSVDGLTIAGVGDGVSKGEGVAPALQAPKSASDARPTASLATRPCQRIVPRLQVA
jgi:hypothetical protein